MPNLNNQANKQSDIKDKISNIADNLGPVGMNGVEDFISFVTKSQLDGIGFLKNLSNKVDIPVLQPLMNDLINVLGSFYTSEEVLCCLIKNLIMTTKIGEHIEAAKAKIQEELDQLKQKEDYDPTKPLDFNNLSVGEYSRGFFLSVTDLGFVNTIDQLIFIIDTIMAFMAFQVNDLVLPNLDFAKLISDSIVGMLIVAMQEIVFTLRDTAIAWVVDGLVANVGNKEWIKCFPFMNLVGILREYIHDYGMLDRLFKLIEGYIGGKHKKWSTFMEQKFPKHVKDLEFLKWLRSVLVKLKEAAIGWEFCIDLNLDGNDMGEQSDTQVQQGKNDLDKNNKKKITGNPDNNINTTLGDNNTILINGDIENQFNKNKIGDFSPPSNSEVNAFLVNHMGISKDLADQLTGLTGRDNVQGTLSSDPHKTNNDCGFVLSQTDLDAQIRKILRSNGLV